MNKILKKKLLILLGEGMGTQRLCLCLKSLKREAVKQAYKGRVF